MPVDVPTEDYFSLNQVAGFSGMDRQEFRKLVGEFERQAGKLPTRINDEGKDTKFIPLSFVHVFEEAAMWMRVEETTVADGMAQALSTKRSGALEQLAATVQDREPILRLPKELAKQTAALLAASKLERRVEVDLLRQAEMAQIVAGLRKEARFNWWIMALWMSVAVLATGLTSAFRTNIRLDALQQQVNQSTYQLSKQLERIEHSQKLRPGR